MNDNHLHDDNDPFACFDGDDEDDNDESAIDDDSDGSHHLRNPLSAAVATTTKLIRRNEDDCGVLCFHAGTEAALLQYVKSKMMSYDASTSTVITSSSPTILLQRSTTILKHMDDFCMSRHWMMHIGSEKAAVLKTFLLECFENYWNTLGQRRKNTTTDDANNTNSTNNSSSSSTPSVAAFQLLELGTYCGYSALFFVQTLLEECVKRRRRSQYDDVHDPVEDLPSFLPLFRLTTVEVVPQHASIANELLRLAGMERFVDIVVLQQIPDETLLSTTQSFFPTITTQRLDFVFLDHDKSMYSSDLQRLEQLGYIQQGTYVAADNVVFAQIDDYREYLSSTLAAQGIVRTRLVEGQLEYSNIVEKVVQEGKDGDDTLTTKVTYASSDDRWKDGIELTVYLKDPPPVAQ